ncbi:type I-D CRISPR-associated protein Cas7/Csc2 [Orenia metallireducens]|uniref:Type I-D CRISPR-associated protein Cas7/Csc2 n=1 Tax=Orenia metallireducens TaxID=1413210 RepID=A0A1C0A8A6_9FIRM|nr:type I-D CRISPR-associated protein Cas7/Csc2 [Orenia metallireducens]OCL26485.1 type I-D CRISPR-associated protein Cas7/Csc2 [Orenia metallireducens]
MTLLDNQNYSDAFVTKIPKTPRDKYVSIVVLRESKSHAVFTTEGTILDGERVRSGVESSGFMDRILMYKRKQVAPERRKGKSLLRDYKIFENQDYKKLFKKIDDCYLMEGMCGVCPDCILYGYAAGGADSQKSRILTDSGFTIRGFEELEKNIKFNAIEDSTKGGVAGSSFNAKSHIIPEIYIPTVETLVDVTENEFIYVLGNILRTTRYGAESNRQGTIKNHIVDIIFSDSEIASNLELTQRIYDKYQASNDESLTLENTQKYLSESIRDIEGEVFTPVYCLSSQEGALDTLLTKVRDIYSDCKQTEEFINSLLGDIADYVARR